MEHREIDEYLNALSADDCCRVDETLKTSSGELTQRVSFIGRNGAVIGPFVRKTLPLEAHAGSAYRVLRNAWESGRRFKHLPRIYDCHECDDELIVIMEHIPGSTLAEEIEEAGPSLELAQRVASALCDAASELHESFEPPLIHRDIKPSNIIISGDDLTIIDFGIARCWREDASALGL